jgi:hypothetical protein
MRLTRHEINCVQSLYNGPHDHIRLGTEAVMSGRHVADAPVSFATLGSLADRRLIAYAGAANEQMFFVLSELGLKIGSELWKRSRK